ncbi:MAG: transglutaminase domain-containing protein, partial [Acidobacteriota bacterium]
MPRAWFWFATSLTLLAAVEARAATRLQHHVDIRIRPDGTVSERTRLVVRLDANRDLTDWGKFSVYLDEHRSLLELEASVVKPGGEQLVMKRKDQDTMELSSSGSLHDSAHYRVVNFRELTPGAKLIIDYELEIAPYYPADVVGLAFGETVQDLRVHIEGGGVGWRWRFDGPADEFDVVEFAGGVTVTASELPASRALGWAPSGSGSNTILRFAWGEDASWSGVGSWYSDLLRDVPRDAASVRQLSGELTAGLEEPRQRLESLLSFVRKKVRYVAVEIGIGGFRPTAPVDVLARRWGDCKDKSLLLIDLLKAAGIEAHPALIYSGSNARIDEQFPSLQFNHLIVAVPAEAVSHSSDEPVSGGFLFVDPTQDRGSARWLQPADQDQHALVVHEGRGSLVHTAIRQQLERRSVRVDVEINASGDAVGKAGLQLSGQIATPWLRQIESEPVERTAEGALAVFSTLLPGVAVDKVGWSSDETSVPTVDMAVDLTYRNMLRSGARSFKVPSLRSTPEPRVIVQRQLPIVVPPQVTETTWRVRLPEGVCLPAEQRHEVDNSVGT